MRQAFADRNALASDFAGWAREKPQAALEWAREHPKSTGAVAIGTALGVATVGYGAYTNTGEASHAPEPEPYTNPLLFRAPLEHENQTDAAKAAGALEHEVQTDAAKAAKTSEKIFNAPDGGTEPVATPSTSAAPSLPGETELTPADRRRLANPGKFKNESLNLDVKRLIREELEAFFKPRQN